MKQNQVNGVNFQYDYSNLNYYEQMIQEVTRDLTTVWMFCKQRLSDLKQIISFHRSNDVGCGGMAVLPGVHDRWTFWRNCNSQRLRMRIQWQGTRQGRQPYRGSGRCYRRRIMLMHFTNWVQLYAYGHTNSVTGWRRGAIIYGFTFSPARETVCLLPLRAYWSPFIGQRETVATGTRDHSVRRLNE